MGHSGPGGRGSDDSRGHAAKYPDRRGRQDSLTLIFISDLHLDDINEPRFRRFSELLEVEARRATGIYLLGDLTEVWVGDDDDGPLALFKYLM